MSDLISRQAAISTAITAAIDWHRLANPQYSIAYCIGEAMRKLPSAQPEKTEYIPDTKAVPSKRDCVDLAERVTATFYDQEHEEWAQRTVTISDVLDSVCDDYTILPSAQPEIIRCKDCRWWDKYNEKHGYCMAAKHGYYSNRWEIHIRRTYGEDFFCADAEPIPDPYKEEERCGKDH